MKHHRNKVTEYFKCIDFLDHCSPHGKGQGIDLHLDHAEQHQYKTMVSFVLDILEWLHELYMILSLP